MKAFQKSVKGGAERVMLGKAVLKERPSRKRDGVNWKFSIEFMRLREIENLIRYRHQRGIPDPTGTDDFESCFAYIFAVATTPRSQSVVSWCQTWAPWYSDEALLELVSGVGRRKYMLGADAVAKLLHVTMKERDALGFKTIGACDLSADDRKAVAKDLKRERDRSRQERRRRSVGMIDRQSQQAETLENTKPWELEGISRRAWFYRQKKLCTEVSRVEDITNGDSRVQSSKAASFDTVHMDQFRAAGLIVGLGDHPPAELQEAAPHGKRDIDREEAA